jgi:small conductance mechanosensitive channel
MGVQSIDVSHFQVRLVARTLPGKQFDVGRMLSPTLALLDGGIGCRELLCDRREEQCAA